MDVKNVIILQLKFHQGLLKLWNSLLFTCDDTDLRWCVFLWWLAHKGCVWSTTCSEVSYFILHSSFIRLQCLGFMQTADFWNICACEGLWLDVVEARRRIECFWSRMCGSERPRGPFAAVRPCLFSFRLERSCELILLDTNARKPPDACCSVFSISLWDESISCV